MQRIGHCAYKVPSLHMGAIMSGNEVLAYDSERTAIAERAARAHAIGFPLCVEMEGAGLAACAERLGASDRLFMVRGISDYADDNKSIDELQWRRPACENAAFFGVEFIKYFALQEDWADVAGDFSAYIR
jgi:nucleoside phosphorylase